MRLNDRVACALTFAEHPSVTISSARPFRAAWLSWHMPAPDRFMSERDRFCPFCEWKPITPPPGPHTSPRPGSSPVIASCPSRPGRHHRTHPRCGRRHRGIAEPAARIAVLASLNVDRGRPDFTLGRPSAKDGRPGNHHDWIIPPPPRPSRSAQRRTPSGPSPCRSAPKPRRSMVTPDRRPLPCGPCGRGSCGW